MVGVGAIHKASSLIQQLVVEMNHLKASLEGLLLKASRSILRRVGSKYLPELLSRKTEMIVVEATEGMTVEPNVQRHR